MFYSRTGQRTGSGSPKVSSIQVLQRTEFGSLTAATTIAGLACVTLALSFADSALAAPDAPKPSTSATSSTDPASTVSTAKNKFAVPVKPISARQQKLDADTAKAVNKIPGVDLKAQDLQPPAQDPPIKGFHPIKRALQPVVMLEKNSVQLQQQIMKLEGPIGALQPAMNSLHGKMDKVDHRLGEMDGHIVTVDQHVSAVGQQMVGVRSDLTKMRQDLGELQSPLHSLLGPLNNVAKPLEEVRTQLADMRAMLAGVLFAIVASTIGIAIGTPIMAVVVYKYRHKLFPNTSEHDFPGVDPEERPVAYHPLEK